MPRTPGACASRVGKRAGAYARLNVAGWSRWIFLWQSSRAFSWLRWRILRAACLAPDSWLWARIAGWKKENLVGLRQKKRRGTGRELPPLTTPTISNLFALL